jgi:hypothetical protein
MTRNDAEKLGKDTIFRDSWLAEKIRWGRQTTLLG